MVSFHAKWSVLNCLSSNKNENGGNDFNCMDTNTMQVDTAVVPVPMFF